MLGSLRKQFTWLLVLLVAGQAVVLGLLYRRIRHYAELRAELRQNDARRSDLHALRDAVIDAETGERGFVITGREEFLQPYRAAILTFNPRIDRLRLLDRRHPVLSNKLDTLAGLVLSAEHDLSQLVEVRRHDDFAAAQQTMLSGAQKDHMDQLRSFAAELEEDEQRRALDQEEDSLRASAGLINLAFFGFCGGLLISALIGLFILGRLNRLGQSLEQRLSEMSRDLRMTARLSMRDAASLTALAHRDADAKAEEQATLEVIARMAKDLSTVAMEITSSMRILGETPEGAATARPPSDEEMDRIVTLAGRVAQSALSIELTTAEQRRHLDGTGALLAQIEQSVKSIEGAAARAKQASKDLSSLMQALPGGGRYRKGPPLDHSDQEIAPLGN